MNESLEIVQRLAVVENAAQAAHRRLDTDLCDIKDTLKIIAHEVKDIAAYINQTKGRDRVLLWVVGLLAGAIGSVISYSMTKLIGG